MVVYPEMFGSEVHWRLHCGEDEGITKNYIHWEKKYNILVSSMSRSTPNRTFTGTIKGHRTKKYFDTLRYVDIFDLHLAKSLGLLDFKYLDN